MQPPKVTEVTQLIGALDAIGILKNVLPLQLKGWVNIAGLYVQYRTAGDRVRLEAGGEFRSCFDAMTRIPYGDANDWKIRKYDKETWERRFAHLVFPTHEIALFVSGSPFEPTGSHFDDNAANNLKNVVQHFKITGEWLGLLHKKCTSCFHELTIWEWQNKSCPYCGGKKGEWLWEPPKVRP